MALTLPTFTKKVDDKFVETWYEIRPQAQDNILDANVVTAMLRERGCMVQQRGGEIITRTISYGSQTALAVVKGDTFSQGEPELETMAWWNFRHLSAHIQRSVFDDRENAGKFKIKDYVAKRLTAARRSLVDHYETKVLADIVTDETGKEIQGLNDMVPVYASRATGTYGHLNRNNTTTYKGSSVNWWQPKYKALTLPTEVNLPSDMNNLFNTIAANQEKPNFILSDQTLFEVYQNYAMDASQIVKDTNTRLADLGYDVMRFRGTQWAWTPSMTTNNALFLNTNYIEYVYDPGMWFDMSEWKPIALQGERIAHILCAGNIISDSLRRHGRLYAA